MGAVGHVQLEVGKFPSTPSTDVVRAYTRSYGSLLMAEAERIARVEHRSTKIAVISGVGTRHYYRWAWQGSSADLSAGLGPKRQQHLLGASFLALMHAPGMLISVMVHANIESIALDRAARLLRFTLPSDAH